MCFFFGCNSTGEDSRKLVSGCHLPEMPCRGGCRCRACGWAEWPSSGESFLRALQELPGKTEQTEHRIKVARAGL